MCAKRCSGTFASSSGSSAATSTSRATSRPRSTYNRRNDSSNVSSLLAPDLTRTPDERGGRGARRCVRSLGGRKLLRQLCALHCETCYCRDVPVLPRLHLKPRCAKEDDVEEEIWRCRQSSGYKSGKGKNNSFVRRVTTRAILPTCPEEKTDGQVGGTAASAGDMSSQHHRLHRSQPMMKQGTAQSGKEHVARSIERNGTQSIERTDSYVGKTFDVKGTQMSGEDLQALSRFRKDKYFECHSVGDAVDGLGAEKAPRHRCVHKFTVNERLMPEPINCDSFGVSRCEVCNKPMEHSADPPLQPPPSGRKTRRIDVVRKLYERDLAPPRLNVGSGKETVEMMVPREVGLQFFGKVARLPFKNGRAPRNSLALRYQKGLL